MDTLVSSYGSKNLSAIIFFVADDSRNDAIICSATASSLTLRYAIGVKVDVGLPLFWCP